MKNKENHVTLVSASAEVSEQQIPEPPAPLQPPSPGAVEQATQVAEPMPGCGHGELIITGSLTPLPDPQQRMIQAETQDVPEQIPAYLERAEVRSTLGKLKDGLAYLNRMANSPINEERLEALRTEAISTVRFIR